MDLLSVVASDAPDADRVDGLRVEESETLRVQQLQGALVQVHKQVLTLRNEQMFRVETFSGVKSYGTALCMQGGLKTLQTYEQTCARMQKDPGSWITWILDSVRDLG